MRKGEFFSSWDLKREARCNTPFEGFHPVGNRSSHLCTPVPRHKKFQSRFKLSRKQQRSSFDAYSVKIASSTPLPFSERTFCSQDEINSHSFHKSSYWCLKGASKSSSKYNNPSRLWNRQVVFVQFGIEERKQFFGQKHSSSVSGSVQDASSVKFEVFYASRQLSSKPQLQFSAEVHPLIR